MKARPGRPDLCPSRPRLMMYIEDDAHWMYRIVLGDTWNVPEGGVPFQAVTPDTVEEEMKEHGVRWTYPWDGETRCTFSGLKLRPYKTRDSKSRMACFMSHYKLWKRIRNGGSPAIILEDDAVLVGDPVLEFVMTYPIVGLNDPRGATRRAATFHATVHLSHGDVVPCPWVDEDRLVPQGLAGNSAYYMSPSGADCMIRLTERLGAWPNDALMCNQLLPNMLGVTKKYYTRVSGRKSTLA